MKINSLSINNFYNINFNKDKKKVVSNRQLVSDCFVKSNNIAFCGVNFKEQRKQKVDSFVRDMSTKVHSPKFSINDISNSMKKHVKNVNIKPMSQAPKELLFSSNLQGLYCEELAFDESSNKFFIPRKNRVFYTKTETLNKDFGNIWCAVNAVHELTHALQSEDADLSQINLFNAYVEQNKNDVDSAVTQVKATVGTINSIEENITRPFIDLLTRNEDLAYERIQSGRTDMFSWLCRKSKTEDFEAYVREKVNSGIKVSEKEQDLSIDRNLLFDATINHFEKEIEAYENEGRAFKTFIGIDSARALARVQIYQKSIDVLKEMKQEVV